ncbi:MAG: DUF885 family protein [Vampirovibrio sp.]|nr:DUF885 family protein [Vampirovibrio sp.]
MKTTTINPTDLKLLKQVIQKKELTTKENEGDTVILGTKAGNVGDVKIEFKDRNNNQKIEQKELLVDVKGKKISADKLPAKIWQGLLPLFETSKVTAPSIKLSANNTQFDVLVRRNFGITPQQLAEKAKNNLEQLTKEANLLSKKIKPNAKNWSDALMSLNGQRLKDSNAVMAQYRKEVPKILDYLKGKGWIPKDIQAPRIVEDKTNVGAGASVNGNTGEFSVETQDKAADVYLPFSTKFVSVHELIHAVDFQKNGMSNNPLAEGIAYYIEQKAYQARDFYKTDAEKLQALKWQIIRNARAFLTVELQNQQTTPTEAKNYLIKKVGVSEAQANSEVERMINDPLWRISYVAGSEGIATLWKKVQAKHPQMSYSQFLEKLYNQNGDEGTDGRITTIAKKEFGINSLR